MEPRRAIPAVSDYCGSVDELEYGTPMFGFYPVRHGGMGRTCRRQIEEDKFGPPRKATVRRVEDRELVARLAAKENSGLEDEQAVIVFRPAVLRSRLEKQFLALFQRKGTVLRYETIKKITPVSSWKPTAHFDR